MIAGTFYLIFLMAGFAYRQTAFVTILIVIAYVGLAGAGIPVQRAGYGAVLVLIGVLLGRPANLMNALCFSFFAILIWNPQSLWDIGFQLSFLCVFSLMLLLPIFARVNAWTLPLGSSLAVLFGTFPVVLYHFNIFSPVCILANLPAIPLFDAALFSALFALLLSGVPFLNVLFVKVSSWILALGLMWIKYLSTLRWGYWFFERPSLVRLGLYYASLGLVLIFHRKSFPAKRFLVPVLFAGWFVLAVSFFLPSSKGRFDLTLLASGRNQIAWAHFSSGAEWLINAGRNFPSDQGEWLIAPFLRSQGIQRLEGIMLSDLSKKHTGGFGAILRDFPVRHVLYPGGAGGGLVGELLKNPKLAGRKVKAFRAGDEVIMGDDRIRVIGISKKGSAFLLEAPPWRILIVSGWDEGLLEGFTKGEVLPEIHAVFLPSSGQDLPADFFDWLDRLRPLLVVSTDIKPEFAVTLANCHIPFLDLRQTGALNFKRNGSRLELSSFLKGPLGFYASNQAF